MNMGISLDGNGVMLRPTRRSDCVRRRASEMALPEVKGWLGADAGDDRDLIGQLSKHIGGWDGYDIVRSLESDGWACDARLVEILDRDFAGDAERELVRQWVRCLGIKLDIPVGAEVEWNGKLGVVVKHDADLAQYGVHTSEQSEKTYFVCDAEGVKAKQLEATA